MQVTKDTIKALASQLFMHRDQIRQSDWFSLDGFFIAKDVQCEQLSFVIFKDDIQLGNIYSLASYEHIHATVSTMFSAYIQGEVENIAEDILSHYSTRTFIHGFNDLTVTRSQAGRSGKYVNDTVTKGDVIIYRKCMLAKELNKDLLFSLLRGEIHTLVMEGVVSIEI